MDYNLNLTETNNIKFKEKNLKVYTYSTDWGTLYTTNNNMYEAKYFYSINEALHNSII